jgi:hypothetical protein
VLVEFEKIERLLVFNVAGYSASILIGFPDVPLLLHEGFSE